MGLTRRCVKASNLVVALETRADGSGGAGSTRSAFGGEESVLTYVKERYGFENLSPEAWGNEGMHAFIIGEKIKNPSNGKDADWTEVRQFNLMLNTHL